MFFQIIILTFVPQQRVDIVKIKQYLSIKNNKNIYNENELKDIIVDCLTYVKKYFYELILKIITLVDNIKVKFN